MRWAARNAPIDREMRLCEGFLWLPKRGAGEWRWLERARWREQYIVGTRSTGWFVREWIDNETMEVGRG